MSLTSTPINMISAPNTFSVLSSGRWEITDPNAQELWLQINTDDQLGFRRYIPAAGATLSVLFQRADSFSVDGVRLSRLQANSQSVTKTATADTNDRSLWKISLTPQDTQTILSGTVKFALTEGTTTTTWVQNYFLKKNLTEAGF